MVSCHGSPAALHERNIILLTPTLLCIENMQREDYMYCEEQSR